MTLLHIAEPSQPSPPRYAIGIDLGTTHSLVAVEQTEKTIVLADRETRTLLPSVVHYCADGRIEVGHDALTARVTDPANTIISVKRLMGRSLADIDKHTLPYHFIDTAGMVQLNTAAGIKSPVDISADILRVLKQNTIKHLGTEPAGAVITVPAYFDDAQRQATKDAAQLAGLKVLRLLNEPTAAAIAYGLDNNIEGIYLVYDLGGGTFDVSVLKLSAGIFEVLATRGNTALGGDDFDHALYCWIMQQSGLTELSFHDSRLLLQIARHAKETLSTEGSTLIETRLSNGKNIKLTLQQAAFHSFTQHLVTQTLHAIRSALNDAKIKPQAVSGVVMVGGATRMLHVQQSVAEYFGQAPLTNLNPDHVVALGAARQANKLIAQQVQKDWLLLDVIALSLGVETMGGLSEKIIPRNSTLPIARAQDFTTYKDGQTALDIHVVQGERELVSDCRSLARFVLHGIPPMKAGVARIRIRFEVDADGVLTVFARELTTDTQTSIEVKPSYGLSDKDISRMLRDALTYAQEDVDARTLKEAQVDARRLIDATESALATDHDLLTTEEQHAIRTAIDATGEAVAKHTAEQIKQATKTLNQATESFAAQRMNRTIQRALKGHHIDHL